MTYDRGGEFGFAGQDDIAAMLKDDSLPASGTLLCLRRHVPAWWDRVAQARSGLALELVPIPPSLDPECSDRLRVLWTSALPYMARPVLVFCKEGRHRTGMVAALSALAGGASLRSAIATYVQRTAGEPREREISIIRALAPLAHLHGGSDVP
ncbi:MAG: hypothetical protein ABL912_03350 [Novosphingobium sp.]